MSKKFKELAKEFTISASYIVSTIAIGLMLPAYMIDSDNKSIESAQTETFELLGSFNGEAHNRTDVIKISNDGSNSYLPKNHYISRAMDGHITPTQLLELTQTAQKEGRTTCTAETYKQDSIFVQSRPIIKNIACI